MVCWGGNSKTLISCTQHALLCHAWGAGPCQALGLSWLSHYMRCHPSPIHFSVFLSLQVVGSFKSPCEHKGEKLSREHV